MDFSRFKCNNQLLNNFIQFLVTLKNFKKKLASNLNRIYS